MSALSPVPLVRGQAEDEHLNTHEMMNTPTTETCAWVETEDGQWETECMEIFEFNDGTPDENGFKFCPYCGTKIEERIAVDGD